MALIDHLRTEWRRMFPERGPKYIFSEEILVLGDVLMRQIDPTGKKPIIEPSVLAEGYEPQKTVRSKHRPEHTE